MPDWALRHNAIGAHAHTSDQIYDSDTGLLAPASGAALTVAASDPGAIGANTLWLEVIFGDENDDGGYARLWARNSTDTGWNSAGPVTFSDATSTNVAAPDDNAELTLNNSGTGSLHAQTSMQVSGGGKQILINSLGLHLGDQNGPVVITGGPNPPVIDAPGGSLYLHADGAVYVHTSTPGAANWVALATT